MKTSVIMRSAVLSVMAVLAGGCQVGGSAVSDREGYFTWVDEQGRVRYSPIVESTERDSAKKLETVSNRPPKQSAAPEEKETMGQSVGGGASRTLEEQSEYTLENYPDADQLAKDGYVRPGERQPYFTWRDADGNVRVSYYEPDTRTDNEKGQAPAPIELTPASIYHAGPDMKLAEPVSGSDPDAFAVLGIESGAEDFFTRFSRSCCQGLDTRDHEEWQQGREFGINITDDSPVHDFITGQSPYQLVALSSVITHPDFIMRMRSYAKGGVFVPSLLFLDRNFAPVRLVTDLIGKYEPENWHRRGFLESWIPVFPGQGERWIVFFTRDQDLDGQEVIETRQGPQAIPHVSDGEIGLMMAEED
ncbi:DUF4124 domain-containing protein [Marinobacter sediminum]|nr:DUF4124 domain-containing protein [Marinobacter sediminum]